MKKIRFLVTFCLVAAAIVFLIMAIVEQSVWYRNIFLTVVTLTSWVDFFIDPSGKVSFSSRTGINESRSTIFVALLFTVVTIIVWIQYC